MTRTERKALALRRKASVKLLFLRTFADGYRFFDFYSGTYVSEYLTLEEAVCWFDNLKKRGWFPDEPLPRNE